MLSLVSPACGGGEDGGDGGTGLTSGTGTTAGEESAGESGTEAGSETGTEDETSGADTTDGETEDTTEETGEEHPCGPIDDTHGIVPDDPADPGIVAACTAWCEVTAVLSCPGADTCVEVCAEQACDLCPGTLANFVSCQADAFDMPSCACAPDGVSCPIFEACQDEASATGACGG